MTHSPLTLLIHCLTDLLLMLPTIYLYQNVSEGTGGCNARMTINVGSGTSVWVGPGKVRDGENKRIWTLFILHLGFMSWMGKLVKQ